MMKMNNLSTQIATTREQSERLLAMGVKPETADIQWYLNCMHEWSLFPITDKDKGLDWTKYRKPAWSISRLISMMPKCIIIEGKDYMLTSYGDFLSYSYFENGDHKNDIVFVKEKDVFLALISLMDWLIKNNHFNKEYLK